MVAEEGVYEGGGESATQSQQLSEETGLAKMPKAKVFKARLPQSGDVSSHVTVWRGVPTY